MLAIVLPPLSTPVQVYIKTCRIVMRERSYNHSSRVCRRPLVKQCAEPVSHYTVKCVDVVKA